MSNKDRLASKTADLTSVRPKDGTAPGASRQPKTGPGAMLMARAMNGETQEKMSQLEGRLKEFEGASPARLLDPMTISSSEWANRDEASFTSKRYLELKAEIEQAGGNVQPIKVRPKAGGGYEAVFGHRRHRACLELGLPVLALIDDLDDQTLFIQMDRENRGREDLSPWEQGFMYRRALEKGLFPSQNVLSEKVGVDKGNLSKVLVLGRLADDIVKAFPSPLEIQVRWSKPLGDALQKDPDGVLARAREIVAGEKKLSADEVFDILVGTQRAVPKERALLVKEMEVGRLILRGDRVEVKFKARLSDERLEKLTVLLQEFISK